jgi:uncharacterized protein YtpQ (UPF0354 family)
MSKGFVEHVKALLLESIVQGKPEATAKLADILARWDKKEVEKVKERVFYWDMEQMAMSMTEAILKKEESHARTNGSATKSDA